MVATRRSPVSREAKRPHDQGQDGGEQAAGQEVDRDDVQPGGRRGDRAVEVGEPVVGQRFAGDVRDLRREVAGRDARTDRDVDEQVAPVPAAGDPAVRAERPAVAEQDEQHDRPDRPATSQAGRSAAHARRIPSSDGPIERGEPAMTDGRQQRGSRGPG